MTKHKANIIIAGDRIYGGIDLDDVEENGPMEWAVVMEFPSREALATAMERGYVEFDVMRDSNAVDEGEEKSLIQRHAEMEELLIEHAMCYANWDENAWHERVKALLGDKIENHVQSMKTT
jgi:hypothetical protein